ncbi:unnamed protein product [Cunninghamella blakesleeana]
MENNKDPIIDWILQLDPNETYQTDPSLISTTINATTVDNSINNNNNNNNSNNSNTLSKSELFQLYLSEAQTINNDPFIQQQQQQQHDSNNMAPNDIKKEQINNAKKESESEYSEDDEDMLTMISLPKKTKKVKSYGEPLSGRLDFRPTMTDQVPESQLKAMSPKERRQLRNKISARNFRNRRKQYITTIEEELDKYKDENKRLYAELTKVNENMSKLQEENKQLKLDLVVYQQNIKPTTTINQELQTLRPINNYINNNNNSNKNSTSTVALSSFESSSPSDLYHTSDSSDSPPDLGMFDDFNIQQFSLPSDQQLSTTTTSQFWDLSNLPEFNVNDMYLSHAMMPHWNINVLSKSDEQTSPNHNNNDINTMEVFQKYPLLAPALMSIVIGHTMSLSTNELLKLNYSAVENNNNNKDMIMVGNRSYPAISGLTEKQTLKIWELLQPITENIDDKSVEPLTTTKVKEIKYDDDDDDMKKDEVKENNNDDKDQTSDQSEEKNTFRPVLWAHRCLKAYVCSYVSSYIEQCRIYNTIKQQQQQQQQQQENRNDDETVTSTYRRPCTFSTPLCKHFKRAKERFIPVS